MSQTPPASDDPAVVGVPPETPPEVRPSATGVVAGPVEGDTGVVVADVHGRSPEDAGDDDRVEPTQPFAVDQILEDAEGGVEGSLLDAPDEV